MQRVSEKRKQSENEFTNIEEIADTDQMIKCLMDYNNTDEIIDLPDKLDKLNNLLNFINERLQNVDNIQKISR